MKKLSLRLLFSAIALLLPALLYLPAAEAHRARSHNAPSSSVAKTTIVDSAGETAQPAERSSPTLVARLGGAAGQPLPERVVEARDADDDPDMPAKLLGSIDKETYLSLREEHINRLRGVLPDEPFVASARSKAIRELESQEADIAARFHAGGASALKTNIVSSLHTWVPIGPAPIPNGQTTAVEVPVSGRTTAIAVDPSDPNIVFVGTAQGGLYRTLDGGTTWTPLMDNALSLAIGAVTIDPIDPTIVYVGTGEASFSADSFFGVGVYIIRNAHSGSPSVNGPFNHNAAAADVMSGRAISRILVVPGNNNTIFVATTSGIGGIGATQAAVLPDRGLYRSTNAQAATPTFEKLTVQPANAGNRSITDLVFDPADPSGNTLLASVLGFSTGGNDGGVWRTTNALAPTPTFTITLVLGTSGATVRGTFSAVLAVPGPGSLIYAGTGNSNGRLQRSTDGGLTWSALPGANGFCGGQCFYDIVVAVDPVDPNIVYTGGASGSTIFKKSTDAAATFVRMDNSLHADTHAITLAPSNHSIIYFGSDGGVWRSDDASANWTSLNNANFSATQFQSLALHPIDRNFTIGGTQDNGTPFYKPDATWFRADFGDGGFSLIDQNAADNTTVTMYHTYFNQRLNLIGFARNLTVPCAVEGQWTFHGIYGGAVDPTIYCDGTHDTFNGIAITENVLFYAPMALGPGNPNTIYFGTDRLHRSTDLGDTMPSVSQFLGAFVSSIGISPQDDNVRIVGTDRSLVFATRTGANPLTNVSSASFPANAYVARAVIDPNNSNTAYITFSAFGLPAGQHVWKTTNLGAGGGTTWAASGSGIPDVPVNAFVVDARDSTVLYAGTDIGVYRSTDAGSSWSPFGTGLPRVAVFDMAIQQPNSILRIATHGRGMFEIPTDTLTALSPAKVWIGLKNSDDVGLRVDLLAEVFVNSTKVGQGELDNVGTGSSGFNNALLNSISLSLTGGPASAPAGAQLKIKLSARRNCSDGGHTSGTVRAWYNGQPVDSGAARDAGSRFDATISGTNSDYFLRNGLALSTTAGTSRTSVDVFVNSSAPCPARPFTSFGTWSVTLP